MAPVLSRVKPSDATAEGGRPGAVHTDRPRAIWLPLLAVGLLFLGALGIRLYAIEQPPLEFHASRQYRSLIIARALYQERASTVPEWQRAIAETSQERQGTLEPPLLESITAAGYTILGGEQTWLPRLLSSLSWLAGGVFVYRLAARIGGPVAAVFSASFYLYLPFAVVASRSFQPDPAMVMLLLAGVWTIVRFDERPSAGRLLGAAVVSGAAFLVLPRSVPVLLAVFAVMAARRHGALGAIRSRETLTFGFVSLGLAAVAYGSAVLSGAFRLDIAQGIFVPELILSPFFWRGWLAQIDATVGIAPFLAGLLGPFLVADGRSRSLLLGLWVGYVAFAFVFSYAIATHDYYHLQLVPIVALSLAPMASLAAARVAELHRSAWRRALPVALLVAAVGLGVVLARGRLVIPDAWGQVATKEQIGALVQHSTKTVFLSGDYGTPLEYHGLLAGRSWPLAADLEWEQLTGVPPRTAGERFERQYASAGPEYFIVEDMAELARQPDLIALLERYPVIERRDDVLIVDLRGPGS